MIKFNKLFYLSLIALSIASCVKAQKHEKSQGLREFRYSRSVAPLNLDGYNDAQFTSSDISIVSFDTRVIGEQANIPNQKEYQMQMCGIQDTRGAGSILGQKFDVYSELDVQSAVGSSRTLQITASNGGNCLSWRVVMPFNPLGDSVNLEVNFIFVAQNSKIYIHRKTIFNPWDKMRGNNPEFRDITNTGDLTSNATVRVARGVDEINNALSGIQSKKRKLEISSVSLKMIQKNKTNFVESGLVGDAISNQFETREKNIILRNNLARESSAKVETLQTLDLHLNIRLDNLSVRLYDSANANDNMQLTSGKFKIFAQLVATDLESSGHVILTNQMLISDSKSWTQNNMGVNAVLPISVAIRPQWGNLNLLLKVVPADIPDLEPFEALYNLGRFDSINNGSAQIFDLSEYTVDKESGEVTFSYDEYLKKSLNYEGWKKNQTTYGIDFDKYSTLEKGYSRLLPTVAEILFSRVMPGDTSTDRTIQYTVETCLIDNMTGSTVKGGLKFKVEFEDRGKIYEVFRKTNNVGCLTWVGMISHKFFHREQLIPKWSRVTYMGTDIANANFQIDYYINPWDEKFTFGRDVRRLTEEYLEQIRESHKVAPPTRVLMTHFQYDATGFRYAIDRYMNMTVKKTVLMQIKPVVLKYNSIVWGRSGLSELKDGIYLMKVAMQKDYIDPMANKNVVITNDPRPLIKNGNDIRPMTQEEAESVEKKQFLVVKEMLVRVLGGQIVTPIEFEIYDLRTLRIRSQMLIQLETIDETLLRAALIADKKLNQLLTDNSTDTTIKIMGLQASQDENNLELDQINAQLDALKSKQDLQLIQKKALLLSKSADLNKQLQNLLKNIDPDVVEKVLAQVDEIRRAKETDVSVDRNIKFRQVNDVIAEKVESIRRKIKAQSTQLEKDLVRTTQKNKLQECFALMSNLINRGFVEEGKLYDPNKADTDGSLCKLSLSKDELFYYLSNTPMAGSDEWFKALLTEEEYKLYQSNLLRDDFTNPYVPNFDFNLLSNQGDERFYDDGKPRPESDQTISGLPRRTFIGPVTFVLNGNGSAMRPTDVLDESQCNGTCEALGEVEETIINSSEQAKEEIRKFGLSVNDAYEKSPYFGSVEHFYKKQVNDLQVVDRGLKFQYHQEMKAFSQIGNFLEQMDLKFVSMNPKAQPIKRLDFPCYAQWKTKMEESYRKWRTGEDLSFPVEEIPQSCYVNSDRALSLEAFMHQTKFSFKKASDYYETRKVQEYSAIPVSQAHLKEFSKNGLASQKLDFDTKISILHKMCYLLTKQMYPQTADFKKIIYQRAKERILLPYAGEQTYYQTYREKINKHQLECHSYVDTFAKDVLNDIGNSTDAKTISMAMLARSKQLPVIVERRVRILETSNRYLYKDGKTINYSVGTGFSISHSMSANRGYKMDPMEVLEKTAGSINSFFGKSGKTLGKISGATNGVLGSISGMVNFQWGVGESLSVSDGAYVGENTTLATQISTLDIELAKWEKCIVVRFDETFLASSIDRNFMTNALMSPSDDIQAMGYFICSGDQDTEDDQVPGQPLRVRERYFYLTQIFNEGDMQDPGALANHPWMLQLRGMRDFGRFEKKLKEPAKEVTWWSALEYMGRDLYSAVTLGSDNRLNQSSSMQVVNRNDVAKALDYMSASFDRVLPNFPGMYTYSDTPYDLVLGWPKNQTSNSKAKAP
ncbi:hypothetical protein K2X05_04375 [bacterium]|nr:hypothetical protein [bacterium]